MTMTFRGVVNDQQLALCHQLQIEVFHHQLNLVGMEIPDDYDQYSRYTQILDGEEVIGTYRVVLPNSTIGFPIEDSGFCCEQFRETQIYEMSRLVMRQDKRGKVPFRKIIESNIGSR